jgi:hypothetical protein
MAGVDLYICKCSDAHNDSSTLIEIIFIASEIGKPID